MTWDQVHDNWQEFKGSAKQKWSKLTDGELEQIRGKRDQLEGRLQEVYGYSKEQAQREVDEWSRSL